MVILLVNVPEAGHNLAGILPVKVLFPCTSLAYTLLPKLFIFNLVYLCT